MRPVSRRGLGLGLLLLFTIRGEAQDIPPRNIWIDSSCSDEVRNQVWEEVGTLTLNAALSLPPTTVNKREQLYNYIFKNANHAAFIDSSLEAIESNLVDMDSSNVRIYCDQDSRWVQAPPDKVPKNDLRPDDKKAWYDPANDMVWDNGVHPIPGCKAGSGGGITLAQTYSNSNGNTLLGLYRLKGKDLAIPNRPGVVAIDAYKTLSSIILHELAHTLKNPEGGLWQKWLDHAYKWAGITALPDYLAVTNADSLGYFGLGATIQSQFQNVVNADGSVS